METNQSVRIEKNAARDFIKAYSCSFSVTKNLGAAAGCDVPSGLLHAVVGLGSGIGSMRDTCGSVNAGVAMLGRLYTEDRMPEAVFQALCSEYYGRIEREVFKPDCALVHGDRTRPADGANLEGGVTKKCISLVRAASRTMLELREEVDRGDYGFAVGYDMESINEICESFSENSFHCCASVLDSVSAETGMAVEGLKDACRGFCGGIGLNGTVCGAILGGVFCLGVSYAVDLQKSNYLDTVKITLCKALLGDRVYGNERIFKPAGLFRDCRSLYSFIKQKYNGAHCSTILGLNPARGSTHREFLKKHKIDVCREIVKVASDWTVSYVRKRNR